MNQISLQVAEFGVLADLVSVPIGLVRDVDEVGSPG
jgi:hypothetical protein